MASCDLNTLLTKHFPHILEKILLNLDYDSYKTCLEVNKMWRDLLTSNPYQKAGKSVFQGDILKDEARLFEAIKNMNKEKIKQILSTKMVNFSRNDALAWAGAHGDKEAM